MVSTASAAAQASEMEKRRKQTLERAKANHLSRQLQMRLQYARLKVEHGWQKQNLNEVENLYFHHSHQRGPKPYLPSPSFSVSTPNPASLVSSLPKFSDESYKTWLNSLSRSSALDAIMDNPSQETSSSVARPIPGAPTLTVSSSEASQSLSAALAAPNGANSSRVLQSPDLVAQTPAQNLQTPSASENGLDISVASNTLPTHSVFSASGTLLTSGSSLPQQPQLPATLPFTNGNTIPTPTSNTPTPVSASKNKKSLQDHKNSTSLTTKDMFDFGSTSLTYDSFWSGLQSKSYPALKGGASVTSTGSDSATPPNGNSGTPMGGLSNNTMTSAVGAPALIQLSGQSLATTSTPAPLSLPSTTLEPGPLTMSASSTPSTPPTPPSIPAPAPIAMATAPALAFPNTLTPQQQQLQMQMQNRYFVDNLAAWNFGASPQLGFPPNLIPASLLANPAAFPFLANIGTSYAHTFNNSGGQPHAPMVGVGVVNPGGSGPGTTPAIASTVAPVPTPATAPPLITAFIGQQES
ncbi:hypothetical protein P691DRAFT_773611 [Macrolepiota fuliginosa MF-IS2]|uniref:Uncharacterized protein n=1 Tax=Macrolepiota fuliginosa MF-IS2 TaxID=1400762 RepID=A0A9P6C449_9AGAR|nr:hypothetical protein P691DRAFT_773611 [Macrolepiota fuliginosa MF-IS2]